MDSDSSLTDPPSELSSPGSLSPSFRYPSPNSSQDQDDISTGNKRKLDGGDANPAGKKRKRPEPKPRTTEHLNLMDDGPEASKEQKSQLDLLLKVLRKRRKIVVVAGAGISVSAGSMFPYRTSQRIDADSNSLNSSRFSIIQWSL
jgi:NAD-dependent histone deacetylase SIR2